MLTPGARPTFDLLYEDLASEVVGHAKRLMRGGTLDAVSVEDVTQTVWLKVWTGLDRVEARPGHGRHDGLRSWVHTITRYTVLDLMSRARYRRHVSLTPGGEIDAGMHGDDDDELGQPDVRLDATPATDPHECAVGAEVADALREALAVMTAHQARCLVLAMTGHNGPAIGERLGTSGRAVRHAVLRGRRTFEAVAQRRGVDTCR